jgi:hypothetical protein
MSLESCALRLLACAASALLLVCLLVLPGGPSESTETLSWLLAFAVALPGGLVLAGYQERRLAGAAPAAPARGLAAGLALLAYGLFLRHSGSGDRLHHALLALTTIGALAAPFAAARVWRHPEDRAIAAARALAAASLIVLALLFVPAAALRPGNLVPALALAAGALALLRYPAPASPRERPWLDAAICALIVLLVAQLPDLHLYVSNLVHHQGFFLGPANDVLHGGAMLGDVWSQYGVGLFDALALVFSVVPIGYGTMALVLVAVTAAQYLCVYATLRLAGLGQLLVLLAVAVAALGNLFAALEVYVLFPSVTGLRFGLPYLIVLAAVLGARRPDWAATARGAQLGIIAIGAVWSFEAFVYCGVTYGALVLVEALAARDDVLRQVARAAGLGLAVSAGAVLLYSLVSLLAHGNLDWGPYVEYLRLYSTEGFGELPVVVFSAGPLMAAAIFLSAATLLWLARERPGAISPPPRAALAGFTGLAVGTFTYYLGRSHPNNLLNLLVPVVALGALWTQVLLHGRPERWRTAAAATLLLAGAMVFVAGWPSLQAKWPDTALGTIVRGESLSARVDRLADNPVLDPRAPAAVELLERVPPGPAAVLTEPELTTEILVRAGRRNLLPIADPAEDSLIRSSTGRVEAAAEAVPAGTLLLTSPEVEPPYQVSPTGQFRDFNALQRVALSILRRRFEFVPVASAEGLELVRLEPNPAS